MKISEYTCTLFIYLLFLGSKRRRPSEDDETDDGRKEELWSLRDVVFLTPPLSSTPLGSVMKLDGLYAAVLFPSLSDQKEAESDTKDKSVLSQCRLLRKDDLLVIIYIYMFLCCVESLS